MSEFSGARVRNIWHTKTDTDSNAMAKEVYLSDLTAFVFK